MCMCNLAIFMKMFVAVCKSMRDLLFLHITLQAESLDGLNTGEAISTQELYEPLYGKVPSGRKILNFSSNHSRSALLVPGPPALYDISD